MTIDDIRTLLYRGVAWYSREQVQVLLEAYDGAQAQREFEKQAYAKDRDARDRISREVVDHLIAERDAQAQPVTVEGPEHLAPRPAPGLVFDARGVLVPVKYEPVARVFVQKTGGNVGIRWTGVPVDGAPLMRDGELLYASPQPPADVPRLTDEDIRAAVEAERELIVQALKNEMFRYETDAFTKGYNVAILNCIIAIESRGAA